jgi:hypothetical protein
MVIVDMWWQTNGGGADGYLTRHDLARWVDRVSTKRTWRATEIPPSVLVTACNEDHNATSAEQWSFLPVSVNVLNR